MRSAIPKALHQVAGRPMLAHALAALQRGRRERDRGRRRARTRRRRRGGARLRRRRGSLRPDASGAARRTRCSPRARRSRAATTTCSSSYADTPLMTAPSLKAPARKRWPTARIVAALAFETANPTGYGRLIERDGRLAAIREEKDATASRTRDPPLQRRADGDPRRARARPARRGRLRQRAEGILPHRRRRDRPPAAASRPQLASPPRSEVLGVNDRLQLAAAEAAMQRRLRRKAMLEGATLIAPETVFLSADAAIGRDVTIEPHVVFGPGVTIGDGAVIHAFSHLEGREGRRAAPTIGPYARLRPGADSPRRPRSAISSRSRASTIEAGRQGQPSDLHRRRAASAPGRTSAPERSPAITTASANTAPTSARAPSSAPIRRWSRRSRSATAPMSAPARSSPRTSKPTRSPSRAAVRW